MSLPDLYERYAGICPLMVESRRKTRQAITLDEIINNNINNNRFKFGKNIHSRIPYQ